MAAAKQYGRKHPTGAGGGKSGPHFSVRPADFVKKQKFFHFFRVFSPLKLYIPVRIIFDKTLIFSFAAAFSGRTIFSQAPYTAAPLPRKGPVLSFLFLPENGPAAPGFFSYPFTSFFTTGIRSRTSVTRNAGTISTMFFRRFVQTPKAIPRVMNHAASGGTRSHPISQ